MFQMPMSSPQRIRMFGLFDLAYQTPLVYSFSGLIYHLVASSHLATHRDAAARQRKRRHRRSTGRLQPHKRCLLALFCYSCDWRNFRSTGNAGSSGMPNRYDERQDAAENQPKSQVVRRLRKIGRLDPGILGRRLKNYDREAEADQRHRGAQHRHQRAFDAQPRAQPAEMRVCCWPDFKPLRDGSGMGICHPSLLTYCRAIAMRTASSGETR